ncbi:hypothetical protein D3C81_2003810 [compost metagenome]
MFADQQWIAALGGEGIDQGGDVLIGGNRWGDSQHIVRVLTAIGVDEHVKVLRIAERRTGHGVTS